MPVVKTKYFGEMACGEDSAFDFPLGLPGFENETRFVLIENPEQAPLVFLQSVKTRGLCFLALPVAAVEPDYRLEVGPEDRAAIEVLASVSQSEDAILALTLLSLHDGFPATANLMAPVVANLKTRRAVQAIRSDRMYSHQHPVEARSC